MPEDIGASERDRRERAYEHRGELAQDSAESVAPRRLDHAVSVRLDPQVLTALRNVAESRETTVSDLLREGAQRVLEEEQSYGTFRLLRLSVSSPREARTQDVTYNLTAGGMSLEYEPIASKPSGTS